VTERVHPKEQEENRKKDWGPFHLYLLISAALIIAMWGLIIRGGEPPPPRTAHFVERPTLLLFLVDGAISATPTMREVGIRKDCLISSGDMYG